MESLTERMASNILLGAVLLALLLIVSCNEPTEVSVTAPRDTLFHFDTVTTFDTTIVTVTDTIWCKRKHRRWICLDVRPLLED